MPVTLVIALATAAVSLAVASAASLPVAGPSVAAGTATVASCDADGVSPSYATTGGIVTGVTVGGIADPACDGAEVQVVLTLAGTRVAQTGPTVVPADGDSADGSVALPIASGPAADAFDGVRIAVTGP